MLVPCCSLLAGAWLAAGFQELHRETWPDGTLREEYQVERKPDGSMVKSGAYRAYRADGRLEREGVLIAGQESGKWTFYHPSGAPQAEGSFARGKRTGLWKTLHEGGVLASKGRYEDDERAGPWVFQHLDGSRDPVHSGEYSFESRQIGQRCFKGPRLDGERHGPWIVYWPSLAPMLSGTFVRGVRAGEWLFSDPDGRTVRLLSGPYEGGRRAGLARASATPAPGSFPPVLDSPLGPCPQAEGVAGQLKDWLALPSAAFEARAAELEGAGRALPFLGVQALPVVLRHGLTLKLESPEGRQALARLERIFLRPLCRGRGLAPPSSPDSFPDTFPDPEAARAFLHAWTTLWAATREMPWFWSLDLAAPLESAPEVSLLEPPLFEAAGDPAVVSALYAGRFAARRGPRAEAIELGLEWLERARVPEGGWRANRVPGVGPGSPGADVGITGLALLAFLGAGETPASARYAQGILGAVAWLLSVQDERGAFKTSFEGEGGRRWIRHDWLTQHMVATQALAELLALQPRSSLRVPVQRAVSALCQARNPYGAWRYASPPDGENDALVTAFAVQALHAAREVKLEFDPEAFQGALTLLDEFSDPASGRTGYSAFGELPARYGFNEHHPREKGEAPTAGSLLSRLLLGRRPEEDPILGKQAELLRAKPPCWDPDAFGIDETYFFLGSQALALFGSRFHAAWDKALETALVDTQREDGVERGSWEPAGAWGAVTGRIGTTALMLLSLEAPFRLKLPASEPKPARAGR